MYKIVGFEGIDQIGKSTLISTVYEKLKESYNSDMIRIEKPTIGINTLDKNAYPFRNLSNVMEIRHCGLFEELLFQIQKHNETDAANRLILRDRFHLSELAYAKVLRPFAVNTVFSGFAILNIWTRWFEDQLQKAVERKENAKLIVFVLDDESVPNDDESVSSKNLKLINDEFKILYQESTLEKTLIELHKDPETGLTNILHFVDEIITFINGYDREPCAQSII